MTHGIALGARQYIYSSSGGLDIALQTTGAWCVEVHYTLAILVSGGDTYMLPLSSSI